MPNRKKPIKRSFVVSQKKFKTAAESASVKPTGFMRALQWLDNNILFLLSAFLFAFIPLYPKLPLADLIPGYIVRLRLEDLFVGATVLIYLIQLARKKAEWKTPFTWLIAGYAVVGLLSTLSGMYITKTIPLDTITMNLGPIAIPFPLHIAKSLLHYFRYIEYFSLFFVAYTAVNTKKKLSIVLALFAVTVILVTIYGYGQKYYYWPVYSTMNREFSKGQRLILTEHARVQSTFGGHYDMAGYLVIAVPMLLALFFSLKDWRWKVGIFVSYLFGLWLMIMSASRTSFAALVISIMLILLLYTLQQPGWLNKIKWAVTRGTLTMLLLMYMFFTFGESIEERFNQVLEAYPPIHRVYNDFNDTRKKIVTGQITAIAEKYGLKMPEAKKPENAITVDELEEVLVGSDQQPVPDEKNTDKLPGDVYKKIPDLKEISTISAEGVATKTTIEVDRTWSDNAYKYGLSMAIRLDTLWPQAIAGFRRNPLVGSGYATLTKDRVDVFTEAESTDNNFLRTLGETGLLGFITFYGLIAVLTYLAIRILIHSSSVLARAISIGIIGATIGLLINAIFIDVFASSKVAFTYWALSGFVVAYFVRELKQTNFRLSNHQVKSVLPKPNQ